MTTAIFMAWCVARTDTPFRRQFEVLLTLPFFIPPILTAMAWGMLGNKQVGVINMAWQWMTGATTSPIGQMRRPNPCQPSRIADPQPILFPSQ